MRRFLVLLAVAIAGCGGGDDDAGTTRRSRSGSTSPPTRRTPASTPRFAPATDEDNGVRIQIRPPAGGSPDSLKLLATGRADIGVLDIHDLGLALERGEDVVAVGALVQRPLAAVIARRDSGVDRPRELEGHRVGVAGLPSDDAVLRAVVEHDGGDFDEVDRVTIGFGAVANLLAGKVDAATAFWNAEGVVLRERGLETREFRVDDFGAPRYPEVVLVVRRDTLERAPRRHRRRGEGDRGRHRGRPRRSRRDRQEIAAASSPTRTSCAPRSRRSRPAMSPPLVLRREAVEGWARFASEFGILEREPDVDRAFEFDLLS